MHPKYEHYSDEEYLQWIREQPSCVSGLPPPSDPHHVWNTGKKGKRNDYLAVPLTREEHSWYHSKGHESFEIAYNVSFEHLIIRMLSKYIGEKNER